MFGLFRSKTPKPPIFQGSMDCHSHILWGVDDGARTCEESQAMIDELRRLGFRGAWCTPHIMANMPHNTAERLKERFNEAINKLDLDDFDLRLAGEYMLDEQFPAKLDNSSCMLTYDGTHLLVELPQMALPRNWEDMIFQIKLHGYIPVLAHPERYGHLLTERKLLYLHENNVEFQLNLTSLKGHRGKSIQKLSERLIQAGTYTWWGSDAHTPGQVISLENTKPRILKRLKQISLHDISAPNFNQINYEKHNTHSRSL